MDSNCLMNFHRSVNFACLNILTMNVDFTISYMYVSQGQSSVDVHLCITLSLGTGTVSLCVGARAHLS